MAVGSINSVRLGVVFVVSIGTALALAACSGGGNEASPTAGAPSDVTRAADSRAAWATPVILPVTPAPAPSYNIADPMFQALSGARAIFGTDGSVAGESYAYQIEVPADWNGDAVFFAHGFRGYSTDLTVSAPPIRDYLIEHGFAWAASSYAENGYRPGTGARDTNRLRGVFERAVGQPKHSYLYGQSMGGNVVTVTLESPATSTVYDGALSECGAMMGTGIVDYFLSWGALAGYLTGTDLTSVATDAGTFVNTLTTKVRPALGSPDRLTLSGKTFASAIENLTGGPRPYFREGFAANYQPNFVVLLGAVVSPGPANAVAQNADTQYAVATGLSVPNDQLNREIARVRANEHFQDAEQYPEFAPSTGKIQRPLLTLHGTGDLFVPISLEQQYRRLVEASGAGALLVQRAVRRAGHCMFTQQERERAFADLVAWVERGEQPAGEDLLGDLADAGREFTSPLGADDPGGE